MDKAIDEAADRLADEMRFAKLVSTETGDGVLIGGQVYRLSGPHGGYSPEVFVRAMRRAGRSEASGICGSGDTGKIQQGAGLGTLAAN